MNQNDLGRLVQSAAVLVVLVTTLTRTVGWLTVMRTTGSRARAGTAVLASQTLNRLTQCQDEYQEPWQYPLWKSQNINYNLGRVW